MSQVNHPAAEQALRKIVELERRLRKLERSGAGLVCVQNFASTSVFANVASPGNALVGTGYTVTRAGRHLCICVADTAATATGWTQGNVLLCVNGVDATAGQTLAVWSDNAVAGTVRFAATFVWAGNFVQGDVLQLYGFKSGAGGTLNNSARTCLTVVRTGP